MKSKSTKLKSITTLFEVTVDGSNPTLITAEALMEACLDSAPDGVAKAFDLPLHARATILERPLVQVRRLL